MQSSYVLLLDDRLKPLGHFADQTLQATSDYDVFRNLCLYCIPFTKRTPLLQPFCDLWDKNLRDYHRNWEKAQKEATQQLTKVCALIKQRLSLTQLLKDKEIQEQLASVQRILNGEERVCLQPHYEIANERMNGLLQMLSDKGDEELLIDLANISYQKEKASLLVKSPLHSFSFAPALSDLQALKKKKSRDNFHDLYIAWENLCLAHWCWIHGKEYFQRQELIYDSIQTCAQSSFLFGLHRLYCEMNAIKEKIKRPYNSTFFSQKTFKEYLKALMNNILLFQEELIEKIKPEEKIHALRLELDYNLLYLSVEWTKDKDAFQYLLHSFQENSAQLEIFRLFFNEIENRTVDLKESTTGNNSTKFLQRIGLVNELKSIFVEKTSTYTVTFRGKRVELNSLAPIDHTKLIQQIEMLPIKGSPYEKRNYS